MRICKRMFSLGLISLIPVILSAQVPEKIGFWKFDDPANLTKAEPGLGSDLTLSGSQTAIAGPDGSNGAVNIGTGSYYTITHGINANGGGDYVNEWSLQVDFRIPVTGKWYSILQTNTGNANDADFFIKPDGTIGVGSIGYTTATVSAGEWYRLVLSINAGTHFRYYLDGVLIKDGEIPDLDGRFALDPELLIFADDDGDDAPIDVAEVGMWDKPLSTWEAKLLGGFGHIQPVDPLVPNGRWTFENPDRVLEGVYGRDLELNGTHEVIPGPGDAGKAVRIGAGSYYKIIHDMSASPVNEYTLQTDIRISQLNRWYTIYQTDTTNSSDGDLFINKTGNIGTASTGYTAYSLLPNEWYRMVLTVKNGDFFRVYLDGQLALQGTKQDLDGRFSLSRFFLLFGDNDGDDAEIDAAEATLWNHALSATEVTDLAGFGHKINDDPGPTDPLAGWWKFDDTNDLLKAETGHGKSLVLVGTHEAVAGPDAGNGAVKIGPGSHYKITHGIAANGGGTKVNEFSLRFDFKVDNIGAWRAFFQTSAANNTDADCFINSTGSIGTAATGYTPYRVLPGEWYRLVISVKNGSFYRYYLDGQLVLEGTMQPVDGRFSLESALLALADEDGEDGEITIAEMAIWNYPLTSAEINALGGYGHNIAPVQMTRIPYLQTPKPTSIYVTWHDTSSVGTAVNYGTTSALGSETTGTSEIISGSYRWHTVKLTGLTPNTEYFYKVTSGGKSSDLYKFRTLPDSTFNGHIRFVLFSDTHCPDSTYVNRVMRASRNKAKELYGPELQNGITAVLHSGDLVVSGNSIGQYNDQFFLPLSTFSTSVPVMTTIGNHEGESAFYYNYMKYEELSDVFTGASIKERIWSLRFANTLVISLNTNITKNSGIFLKTFLEKKAKEAEADSTLDFVFVMFHHPPFSELWYDVNTYDAGSNFVRDQLIPIMKKYPKVRQITYGHTHAYEIGTVESDKNEGDFRMVCAGGGGGDTDNWGEFANFDYPAINAGFDNYFYQIVDIDVANKSYVGSVYSIGNWVKVRDNELIDSYSFKMTQPNPEKPVLEKLAENGSGEITVKASPIVSPDKLMTSRIQFASDTLFTTVLLDSMVNWRNIYGVDASFNPIDKNAGIDLTSFSVSKSLFNSEKGVTARIRYRDMNLKWSDWSKPVTVLTGTGVDETHPIAFSLDQNYPNPFNPATLITYQIPQENNVTLKVFDALGRQVATLVNTRQAPGTYKVPFNAASFSSGIYYYRIETGLFTKVKKMVFVK